MNGRWQRDIPLILAVSFPFLFWGIGSISLLDPDEGMYGSIAREMAVSGDWVTPRFNGVRYLEKPPLQFWLSALTIHLFGPSEWAVRLWSALPAFGTALLVWRLGEILYGGHAGVLSAVIFVSSVGVFRYVRVAATDFLMVFSLTLAIYGFVLAVLGANGEWRVANRASRLGSWEAFKPSGLQASWRLGPVLFWLGMALGVLSKGLIGVVFPLLIVGLFGLASAVRQSSNVEDRRSLFTIYQLLFTNLPAILLFLALTLPWHLLAAWRNEGFFEFYVIDNQFLRFLNSRAFIEDDVSVGTAAFLLLTLLWFFPWSLFLPVSLRYGFSGSVGRLVETPPLQVNRGSVTPAEAGVQGWGRIWIPVFTGMTRKIKSRVDMQLRSGLQAHDFGTPRLAGECASVVGLWAVVVLGFFSLSSSKLEHYFLPVVPALSLMVGALWAEILNRQSSIVNRKTEPMLKWSFALGALGCSIVGVGLFLFSDRLTPEALLTGLAELNVYYRIVREQATGFPFESLSPFVEWLKVLGVILAVGLPLAFFCYLRLPKLSVITLLATAGGIHLLAVRLDLLVEPHHSSRLVSEALASRARFGDVVVHEGSLEYSGGLPFYTGREIYVLNGDRGSLGFGSRYTEAAHLFLDDPQFAQLWNSPKRIFLVRRFQERGSRLDNTPMRSLSFIGHYGSRWLYTNQPVP